MSFSSSWSVFASPSTLTTSQRKSSTDTSIINDCRIDTLKVVGQSTMKRLSVIDDLICDKNISVRGNVNAQGNISTQNRITARAGFIDPEVGDIKMHVSPIERNGWLLCDGRAISRTDHKFLFDLIGTTFGCGDHHTTFNVPNASNRILGSVGTPSQQHHSVGDTVGAETQTLSANNLPSHIHTGTTNSTGEHIHDVNDPGHVHSQTTVNDDFNSSGGGDPPSFTKDSSGTMTWQNINSNVTGISLGNSGTHSHTFQTNGGVELHSAAFGIMQPTLFIGYTFIFCGKNEDVGH